MTSATNSTVLPHETAPFDAMVAALQSNCAAALTRNGPATVRVDPVLDLNEVFLSNLPLEERQYHTCNACKRFLRLLFGEAPLPCLFLLLFA